MNDLEIGIVTILYDRSGFASAAAFVPTMKLPTSLDILSGLTNVQKPDQQKLEANADEIFGTWFAKMNEIELADRDKYEIARETLKCETWESGEIKRCVIRFVFRELKVQTA